MTAAAMLRNRSSKLTVVIAIEELLVFWKVAAEKLICWTGFFRPGGPAGTVGSCDQQIPGVMMALSANDDGLGSRR
jgi:hypothetical protein